MHRIHPPTRALDLVVRDFASLNLRLRQHRASSFFAQTQHHSRRFFHAGSTEPFRLHIETEELGDRRWRDDASGLRITGYGGGEKDVEVGQVLPLEVEEGDGKWRDDGWHAEVEIKAMEDGAGMERSEGSSGMQKTAAAAGTGAALVSGHSPAGGSKSRAESRLLRRQRRELAGNYKPAATAREQQPAREQKPSQEQQPAQVEDNDRGEGEGHDSVLSMIEKMEEDPTPSKTKAKTATTTTGPERLSDEDFAALKAERKAARDAKMKATSQLKANEYKLARDKRAAAPPKPKLEDWQIQKRANLNKFGDAVWQPRKRLSPDTLEGIRALHASDPVMYSTETLSNQFEVSAENIRRILKSKWRPNDEERDERSARWERRGVRKWTEMAEQGERPPRRWREMGVGSVKGEPERRPGWKRGGGGGGGGGGKKMDRGVLDADWEGEEFGERIL